MIKPSRTLADVADLQLGKMLDQKKNKGVLMPYLANVNVRWGDFNLDDLREMRFEHGEIEKYGVRQGDIIMCEGGEPGRCAIWIGPDDTMMIQKALHRIRAREGVDGRYLYYFLRHEGERGALAPLFTGSTIKHLPKRNLARVKVSTPSLDEQREVASVLSAYDDLTETNRQRIARLEEAARLLYREWFVWLRFPGHDALAAEDGVPEGWETKPLLKVAKVKRGKSYRSANLVDAGGSPFINLKCIEREGGFRDDGVKRFEGEFDERHTVRAGDIVMAVTDMTRDRAIVGRSALVPATVTGDAVFSMDLVRLDPSENVNPNWFYMTTRHSLLPHEVKEFATGTNVLHLKPKHISDYTLTVPPRSIQDAFADIVGPMTEQQANLQHQNARLAEARDILLPRLMSGEVTLTAP